jgi:hypothetical protein
MSSFVPHVPKAQPLKVEAGKEPVIKELEVEEAGGVLGVLIGDPRYFVVLSEFMSHADFRGFKFEGASKPWALPCGWVNKKGEIMAHKLEDSDRFVHASHVLREVSK